MIRGTMSQHLKYIGELADALQAILDAYREQTVAVGGREAGRRFDAAPAIKRAVEAIKAARAKASKK